MLELKEVTKIYNYLPVVKEISFTAGPGEILGYLGPNGAGKSTTIKMLAGLIEPNGGHIYLDGRDINQDIVAYKRRIGYIPEQAEIYPHLSGREYLLLVGRLRLIPEKIATEKIDFIMAQLGMGIDMHRPIVDYSKGMQQKVLITAAMLHNPDILLLDEPLSGLDVSTVLIFKDILDAFSKLGKIIIFCSHLLEVVERICNRVIILDKGAILADNSISQLQELMHLASLESVFKELIHYEGLRQKAQDIVSAFTSTHS